MLTKTYGGTGRICRVTFQLPAETGARIVTLCGDFNDCDPRCHYMEPVPGGDFQLTLMLHPGRSYRFRYLLDGRNWAVDPGADGYMPGGEDTEDAVIDL